MRDPKFIAAVRPVVIVGALVPLALLVWNAFHDALGTNPIETLTRATGDWTLRLLLLTLAVTPARHLLNWPALLRLRRTFGRLTFFYACLHFLTYVWLDQFFDLSEIAKDVVKRPFITAGFLAFVLLLPLIATSNRRAMLRLGRRWQQLHRLVYLIGVAGVLHYWWLVKADVREPAIYAVILGVLLGYRVWLNRARLIGAFGQRSAVRT